MCLYLDNGENIKTTLYHIRVPERTCSVKYTRFLFSKLGHILTGQKNYAENIKGQSVDGLIGVYAILAVFQPQNGRQGASGVLKNA